MKFIYKSLVVLLVLFVASCSNLNLEDYDRNSPNAVTPANAGVDFLYNNIQLDFNTFYRQAHGFAARPSRLLALTGGELYQSAYGPGSFDGIWNTTYAGLYPDMSAMIELADAGGLDMHVANVQIMKAYVLLTTVDMFNDIPYSEANQGTDFISPRADDAAGLYTEAEALLDDAIDRLTNNPTASSPSIDYYYNGNKDNWIALANTLKLKMYLNLRLIDGTVGAKITALLGQNIIDSPGEDFQFQYGTSRSNPNNRHPDYNGWYEQGDGTYMSNWFMYMLLQESKADVNWNKNGLTLSDGEVFRTADDPRARFYFYRQDIDLSNQDGTEWGCFISDKPDEASASQLAHYTSVDPNMPYCYARIDGYWGRDHGNGEGIPPDGRTRTAYGLYPVGGLFDENSNNYVGNSGTDGPLGAGIEPIMLSSFVDFMRAEAAMTLATGENAAVLLEDGIRGSFAKVESFLGLIDVNRVIGTDVNGNPITIDDAYLSNWDQDVDDYVSDVMDVFNAATAAEQMDILMEEYFIALFGNGVEAYNGLRRTSKPSRVQPMLQTGPGDFIWSALYPQDYVERNQNATQKNHYDKVFWDNTAIDAVK